MARYMHHSIGGRFPNRVDHSNAVTRANMARRSAQLSKRARGQRNLRLPFVPPEKWYEPQDVADDYRVVVESAGAGYRHVLTPDEIRQRLAELPACWVESLEVIQLSQMTRKKRSFPCYGMQWGAAIYLYPIEETFVETYGSPPAPSLVNEARMYGGRWVQDGPGVWKLIWTETAIRDFYLNNILIHELGHLVDHRNSNSADRERYAEWFALEHGYKPTRHSRFPRRPPVKRRHHAV